MNRTEHCAQARRTSTGFVGVLVARLRGHGSGTPSLRLSIVLCLAVLGGVLALPAGSAQALVIHRFEGQISEIPAVGPHGEPIPSPGLLNHFGRAGLAVEAGDLYVNDGGRVDLFEALNGDFLSQAPLPGITFGHGAGEPQVYVRTNSREPLGPAVEVYGAGGCGSLNECPVLLGEWTGADTPNESFSHEKGEGEGGIADLAVDGSAAPADWAKGDVFALTRSASGAYPNLNVVDVFKPEAGGGEEFVTQLKGTPAEGEGPTGQGETFQLPLRVAVSGFNGDLLVVDRRSGGWVIDVFEPGASVGEYSFVRQLSTYGPIESIAADAANGEIYAGVQLESGERVVYEFSAAGALLSTNAGAETPAGKFGFIESLAVDPASHRLFAGIGVPGEPRGFVDEFSGDLIAPDVTTGPVADLHVEQPTHTWGLSLTCTVNPDGAGDATCRFLWGTSPTFGHVAPCAGSVVDGTEPAPVEAGLEGLEPGTTYYYRLQAENAQAFNPGEGHEQFRTPGPGLHSTSTSGVTASSATLEATIDPFEQPTSYRFEYDTTSYAQGEATHGTAIPAAPSAIGAGPSDVSVEQHVQGLSPATTYHYRVVAFTEYEPGQIEEFDGPDRTFVTQRPTAGPPLPDGRGWELVSPPDKHGALIFGLLKKIEAFQSITEASADGRAITYTAMSPTESEPSGFSGAEQILSRRGVAGWSSADISPSHGEATGASGHPEYPFVSEDLSQGLVEPPGPAQSLLSPEASEATPYLREIACTPLPARAGECYLPLVSGKEGEAMDVPPGTAFGGKVSFVGATPDMRHVVLRSTAQLTQTPTGGQEELYEWSADAPSAQRLQLISVDEGGSPATEAVRLGRRGPRLAAGIRPISVDGSRVFWTVGSTGDFRLFLRDIARGETIRIDGPQPGAGGGPPESFFETASADGSRVFFTDSARLTQDASFRGADLYECHIVEEPGGLRCALTDLTPETSAGPTEVQKLNLGASEDGSYVYFVANGVLPGAPAGVSQGTCGTTVPEEPSSICNLYLYHDGEARYIATLSGEDEFDWGTNNRSEFTSTGYLTARVSANGRFAAFMSSRPLSGYDNRDARSGRPDAEVYLYDAQASRLVCASCNPTGSRPHGVEEADVELATGHPNLASIQAGESAFSSHSWVAANIPGATPVSENPLESLYFSRLLSDSGRLFFNSSDSLSPRDTNGQQDVYEFEPAGAGGCSASTPGYDAATGGCLALISSGTSASESGLLDASESGGDVFFLTGSRLVGEDTDTALDVYDAHVCTPSEPCPSGHASAPICEGDGCQSPATAPEDPTPGSLTYRGSGNLTPAPGNKGRGCRGRHRAKGHHGCRRHTAKRHSKTARAGHKRGASR